MKLLFDQNISHRIHNYLPISYSDSSTIKKENLMDSSDRTIWNFAKEKGFSIVTLDSDFNDLNALFGYPPKIIWLRIGNLRTQQISDILILKEEEIRDFLLNPELGVYEVTIT